MNKRFITRKLLLKSNYFSVPNYRGKFSLTYVEILYWKTEDITEMGFSEMCCEDVGWIHLVIDKAQRRATVNMAMNARVLRNANNIVIIRANRNLSRSICLTWLVTILLLISCFVFFPASYLPLKTTCKFRNRNVFSLKFSEICTV
jgi:hypothetical protein